MSPQISSDNSPSRQHGQSLEKLVRVNPSPRLQPFPLWADVYSVIFAPKGELFVLGRIKASCSLQVTYARHILGILFPKTANNARQESRGIF